MTGEKKATVQLNGEFSSSEMDNILLELAKVRAAMAEPVPTKPPSDAEVLEQSNPLHIFRTLADGGVRIWLRHEGFGWIPFTLSATERNELSDFLAKKIGHTHTSH